MQNSASSGPLVQATDVIKTYGGVTALNQASFSCQRGSIHALIGENGAGKSTLIKILCGVVIPDAGDIRFKDKPFAIHSPADAVALGIVPVFQELSLLPQMTVAENIFITNPPRNRLGLVSRRDLKGQTEALFERLGMHHINPNALVSELPLAQRQLVEIAKALSRNPELLILDEGTSALSIHDVEIVFNILRQMRDEGSSVIFISHRMAEVRQIADTLTIFRDGEDVGSFAAGTVSEDEMVQLMIGRKLEQVFPPKPAESRRSGVPALEARNLSWEHLLHDVSFSVGKGEILGLGGLEGQGQGELLFALFGLLRSLHGETYIDGKRVNISSPAEANKAGISFALIPEDRKTQGLILPMSVGDNATLSTLDRITRFGMIDADKERSTIQQVIDQMRVKTPSSRLRVRYLSGGNQQKVVIGKWLLTHASVYLMYDPTRGIDVGTKQEIYQLIRSLADSGAGLLFFSTELSELVGLCDRVLVLYEGRIFRELTGADITEQNIVSAALGLQSSSEVAAAASIGLLGGED